MGGKHEINRVLTPGLDISGSGHGQIASSYERDHINKWEIAWPIYGLSAFQERIYSMKSVTDNY
jgi:hypothetical protein